MFILNVVEMANRDMEFHIFEYFVSFKDLSTIQS